MIRIIVLVALTACCSLPSVFSAHRAKIRHQNCVFPFEFDNKNYFFCTTDNATAGVPWCSTDAVFAQRYEQCVPAPCVFPFTYNNVSYETCTSVDSTYPWCTNSSLYDNNRYYYNCGQGFQAFPNNTLPWFEPIERQQPTQAPPPTAPPAQPPVQPSRDETSNTTNFVCVGAGERWYGVGTSWTDSCITWMCAFPRPTLVSAACEAVNGNCIPMGDPNTFRCNKFHDRVERDCQCQVGDGGRVRYAGQATQVIGGDGGGGAGGAGGQEQVTYFCQTRNGTDIDVGQEYTEQCSTYLCGALGQPSPRQLRCMDSAGQCFDTSRTGFACNILGQDWNNCSCQPGDGPEDPPRLSASS